MPARASQWAEAAGSGSSPGDSSRDDCSVAARADDSPRGGNPVAAAFVFVAEPAGWAEEDSPDLLDAPDARSARSSDVEQAPAEWAADSQADSAADLRVVKRDEKQADWQAARAVLGEADSAGCQDGPRWALPVCREALA